MGYIFAAVAGLLVLFLLLAAIKSGGGKARGDDPGPRPVGPDEPAADEPTPGASDTADPDTAARAQQHVPPA